MRASRTSPHLDEPPARSLPDAAGRYPVEARALLPSVLRDARGFHVKPAALSVLLAAPLLDPAPALERLALLARFAMALRSSAGPYR